MIRTPFTNVQQPGYVFYDKILLDIYFHLNNRTESRPDCALHVKIIAGSSWVELGVIIRKKLLQSY